MGLLDKKEAGAAPANVPAEQASVGTDAASSKKQQKKEALERFKANRAKRAKQQREDAVALKEELQKAGIFDKLTDGSKAFVESLLSEKTASGGGGSIQQSGVFLSLFGKEPKVGDTFTLEEAFNKTFKGKATLDILIQRWAKKGVVVECVVNTTRMLDTKYTLKALPAA